MRRIRVLIVEDEALIALDLSDTIERLGFDLIGVAATFSQALILAEEAMPDLALVDVNLADGRTGPRIARELADRFGTTVTMATGSPEGLNAGLNGIFCIVRKPYTDREIAVALRAAIRHRETSCIARLEPLNLDHDGSA